PTTRITATATPAAAHSWHRAALLRAHPGRPRCRPGHHHFHLPRVRPAARRACVSPEGGQEQEPSVHLHASDIPDNGAEGVLFPALRGAPAAMLEAVLRPGPHLFPDYVNEMPPDLSAVFPPAFCAHLQSSFNAPQLQAIHWAAAHTAAHTPTAPGNAAGTAASGWPGSGGVGGSNSSKGGWPFTLVQGPPGTGKTHTVWGMLNAIHLVHYQRYYHSLLAKLAPAASATLLSDDPASAGAGSENSGSAEAVGSGGGSIEEVLESMDRLVAPRRQVRVARKPRMLVCAPSNAAVDELLSRVLSKGFLDGEMRTYRPDVARVGAEAATPAAQAVSVERRSQQLLQMPAEEAAHHVAVLRHKEGQLACHAAVEEREQVGVEVGRLLIVLGARRGDVAVEAARAQLEASFAEEAEVVFTTASSSGRRIFARLAHGFDMCVFDEAAQASEMAALPPLTLRCQRCVLVGDPQQLPATVISRLASSLDYSRSLLERFQRAGCPTLLLTEQYRMHPAIRTFPSRYFYSDRLTDAPAITALPDEPYHADPLLRPLLFFDVSAGRESHGERSVSYQNTTEAALAVALFQVHSQVTPPSKHCK
ncbi:unnamed protein product, partial [Closterium sp. Yama58-4]